jgi:hypothetical protein
MRRRVTIYALVDPRIPDAIRYVGQTTDPNGRLRDHCKLSKRDRPTYRGHWIASLLADDIKPHLRVLLRVRPEHKDAAERDMIRRMRAAGCPLVNGSLGGDGGALNPEIQARVNAKQRERIASGLWKPVHVPADQRIAVNAKIAASKIGDRNPMRRPDVAAKNSETHRAKAAARGYVPIVRLKRGTPEHSAMVSSMMKNRSPEWRDNISSALKGVPKSKEHASKIAHCYALRNGLLLDGQPTSAIAASRALRIAPKTMRDHAKRHGLTMQATIDHYAAKSALACVAA